MLTLFTVSPAGRLKASGRVPLIPPGSQPEYRLRLLRQMFPPQGALSPWGDAMLNALEHPLRIGGELLVADGLAVSHDDALLVSREGVIAMGDSRNRVVEIVAELVRQLAFLPKPSRMTSCFAYRTVDAAEQYLIDRRDPTTHEVWQVAVDDDCPLHEGDATWLAVPADPMDFIERARRYWAGDISRTALPVDVEVLVPAERVTVESLVRAQTR